MGRESTNIKSWTSYGGIMGMNVRKFLLLFGGRDLLSTIRFLYIRR